MNDTTNRVSFITSTADRALIEQIVARVMARLREAKVKRARIEVLMDIVATHANGCPLRLADLLAADDANFLHDIGGIARHLNRETGQLGGFFRPRFAQPEGAGA